MIQYVAYLRKYEYQTFKEIVQIAYLSAWKMQTLGLSDILYKLYNESPS